MAFQQSTRQPIQRPVREASLGGSSDNVRSAAPNALALAHANDDPSQTWVLFSPTADTATTTSSSVLDSLPESHSQSQQTAGRSRLSDLGSLNSIVRSSAVISEDDAELDSLDSHLADFRPSTQQHQQQQHHQQHHHLQQPLQNSQSTVNLPTHDGLGSFRLGPAVQEHLFAFEQFNPRRVTKRRRSSLERDLSLDLGQHQAENEFIEDMERTRRIEAWRWEHSRVLLEEIQKETRRRRNSELSRRRGSNATNAAKEAKEAVPVVATAPSTAASVEEDAGDWHEQEDDGLAQLRRAETDGDDEGLWSRLTRKFMQEVMGIDDRVLSVLFGEALGDELDSEVGSQLDVDDLSSTPRASNPLSSPLLDSMAEDAVPDTSSSWQMRMIERIARELGMFVHSHMGTHHHPGAFSTFTRVQQMPLPYAGLPVIPETRDVFSTPSEKPESKFASDITPTGTTASLPRFRPTIYQAQQQQQQQQHEQDEEEDDDELIPEAATPKAAPSTAGGASTAGANANSTSPAFTQDEWEQDLDIKLVFRYLRSRFFSENLPHGHAHGHGHGHAHSHLLNHAHNHNHSHSHRHAMSMQEAAVKAARPHDEHEHVVAAFVETLVAALVAALLGHWRVGEHDCIGWADGVMGGGVISASASSEQRAVSHKQRSCEWFSEQRA
ncbi:hypothetical protein F503_00598 [Ophiostoma piceae UAMH 11346]|uniref:Uncharacterized protein n=1 Tax=Ophiostoma piceae (strain UAMH 11346) TaxID=1262450 RepID=S3C7F9_OPHP1|nr:hypothetical protein F503_00598 [Ophiostoma piceae UAMH 11346]